MLNNIVLNNTSIKFGDSWALKKINLEIQQNIKVCIIGMGSSGKSVLLKSILGLVQPSTGNVSVNNILSTEKKFSEIVESFGVVFQKDALFDSLLVWQNVMFKSLKKKKELQLIADSQVFLQKVGMVKDDAFLFPSELSGGMKKRVALARAISHNPELLLLDEPTAGLDPVKTNKIFNLITSISNQLKITVLAVSSDVKRAIKFFDRVIVLKEGEIVWDGKVNEIGRTDDQYIKGLIGI